MPLFSKKPAKKPTRIYFATDLHGSERTFRKFMNAGKLYGGDFLSINPGSENGEGILHGGLVNLVDGKVDSYQLTTG